MSIGVDRRFVLCKKKQFFLNGEVYSLTKGLLMDDSFALHIVFCLLQYFKPESDNGKVASFCFIGRDNNIIEIRIFRSKDDLFMDPL